MPESRRYINYKLHSDVEPYEVLEMNARGTRAKVRRMATRLAPDWKPEWTPGGFVGHCTNNREQRWECEPDPQAEVQEMSLRKDGSWQFVGMPTSQNRGCRGRLADAPRKFHDYNY